MADSPMLLAPDASRRLLPWFFWAQALPALFWRWPSLAMLLSLAAVLLATLRIAPQPAAAAQLLRLGKPTEGWLRMARVLLLPLMFWPRVLVAPAQWLWPNAVVSEYPGLGLGLAITVILLVPVFEEILYRGLLLRALEPWGRLPALIVTSLVFGLGHGPVQLTGTVALGWVLGWLTLEYKSIWPAVLLHAAFNATAGLVFLAAVNVESYGPLLLSSLVLLVVIGGLVATVVNRSALAFIVQSPWAADSHAVRLSRRLMEIGRLWPIALTMALSLLAWWLVSVG